MSLLQGLLHGVEPSLQGLAVHRLRQEAAAAWPTPGASPYLQYRRTVKPHLGTLIKSLQQLLLDLISIRPLQLPKHRDVTAEISLV